MEHYTFGRTKDGLDVTAYRIKNSAGASATILDYGCTIQSLSVPNAQGGLTDVVLGYDTVSEYENNTCYLGAAIGRFANRIGGSEFVLNGKTYRLAKNDGPNHLHGGTKGFDKYIWRASEENGSLIFSRLSPDGEESYPGNLNVKIRYTLTENNEFKIQYDADTDADTVINLTNHSYFNLNGGGSALDHYLQVFSEHYLENDGGCLPTGKYLNVENSPFDFRTPKKVGQDINSDDVQLKNGHGYDHNYVLSDLDEMKKAAVLYSTESGISMTASTTLPGIQVYSANFLSPARGKNGALIDRRYAVCLETQFFPNSMACRHFKSPILKKDEHFHSETVYSFGLLK